MGWLVQAEVTYAFGGERGSVELLAWHEATRTLLVVEIKTVLASSEEMLRKLDAKVRLGPSIARRFGWRPLVIGRLVVLPATRTNWRHVGALAELVGPDLETSGWTIRRWLRAPHLTMHAMWMLTTSDGGVADRDPGGFQRVRRPRTRGTTTDPRSSLDAPVRSGDPSTPTDSTEHGQQRAGSWMTKSGPGRAGRGAG